MLCWAARNGSSHTCLYNPRADVSVSTKAAHCNCKTDAVEKTSETLTGRAGPALLVSYLKSCGVPDLLAEQFSELQKSSKGIALWEAFTQLLCFFMDGTNLALSHFDKLAEDPGYAATIETPPEETMCLGATRGAQSG